MKYRIVYEKAPHNYGAWSPDLWGCVAAGKTLEETRRLMREAIEFHLNGLAKDGDIRPKPTGYREILGYEPEPPRKKRRPARKPAPRAKVASRSR